MTTKDKTPAAISAEIDMSMTTTNPSGEPEAVLTLTFADGDQLILSPSMVAGEIQMHAMMHGFKQKLVDAAAIARNTDTGKAATLADKKAAVGEVYARLLAGEWNKVREGGGNVGGLLLAALVRLYPGKPADDLKAWLDGKTDAEKAALRVSPKVAPIIAEIKAERVKDMPDTGDMLAELEGE